MKLINAFLISLILSSCQSKQAVHLQNVIDSTDKKVYQVLNADSIEGARLRAFIDKQFPLALEIGRNQVGEITTDIKSVNDIDVQHLSEAEPYKNYSIEYYKALLKLKELDVLESNLMLTMLKNDTSQVRLAADQFDSLPRKRVSIHNIIGKADEQRHKAKVKFRTANGLE